MNGAVIRQNILSVHDPRQTLSNFMQLFKLQKPLSVQQSVLNYVQYVLVRTYTYVPY